MTRYVAITQLVAHSIAKSQGCDRGKTLRLQDILYWHETKKAEMIGEWRRDLFHHSQTMQSKYT